MRNRREGLGLSQERIGVALGVSQAQITKYEAGETRIPTDKVKALTAILQIDANFLFGVDGMGSLSPAAIDIARMISALPEHLQQSIRKIVAAIVVESEHRTA